MHLNVQYLAQMKRVAGCTSEAVEIRDGVCLTDLLIHLAERHGDALRGMLLDPNATPRKSLLFFVGDEHADPNRSVRDGDVITILAPMAGG